MASRLTTNYYCKCGEVLYRGKEHSEAECANNVKKLLANRYKWLSEYYEQLAQVTETGDEELAHMVMEKIMALPNIEDDWDKQYVMDQLFSLASETLGGGK